VTIEGDPDLRLTSSRIASIGDVYFEAYPDETLEAFHARLRKIAKAQGANTVILGHDDNGRLFEEAAAMPTHPPP
jgi:hypothetical protein